MAELKPAYLIHGDDHGAIAERRARLRALGEAQGGAAGVELLEGETCTPEGVAHALAAMTFAVGWRVIVVPGAERFKEADVKRLIAPAMASMPPDTTVAFFACEEARNKAPAALHAAVSGAGGQIVAENAVKPWELAGWVREQAARLGLSLDAHAAKTLVAQVGERQQRLQRELEKLALSVDPGDESEATGADPAQRPVASAGSARQPVVGASGVQPVGRQPVVGVSGVQPVGRQPVAVSVEQIEELAARSTAWKTFSFADALVAGDVSYALRAYLRLRVQGERLSGLLYLMASRLRDAEAVSVRLANGESPAAIKRTLRMPARAADRFIADIARTESQQLRAALRRLADLELDTRGGPPLAASRSALSSLSDDTLAVRAILAIAG